jgi:tetratricopeptide (TPR) repeat protein
MRRSRFLAAGLIAVSIAVAASTYRGWDRSGRTDARTPTNVPGTLPGGQRAVLSQAPGRPQLAELDRLIRSFDDQTAGSPSAAGFTFLGQLELQRARLTGDVGSYARARRALEEAVQLTPDDPEPRSLLASVRFTMHDFVGAYELADQVFEADASLPALAVRGDAALELGRYDEAADDYGVVANAEPGAAASLIRLSRLAFLRGDSGRAAELAADADRAAANEGSFGATRSWYAAYRGRLELEAGSYREAAQHLRRAVEAAPDYHVALSGLASVRAAQGRLDDAIRLYERSVSLVPEPTSLAALGDLYAAIGNDRSATDRYATVEAIATLQGANRGLFDRQLALFRADQGGDLDEALEIATRGLETRRDIYGYDVLGWVLFRMGRLDEARAASDEAIAMGTPDARLWFHAGMISAALDEDERARDELSRALSLHPAFDPLLAPEAAEILAELGGLV